MGRQKRLVRRPAHQLPAVQDVHPILIDLPVSTVLRLESPLSFGREEAIRNPLCNERD